MNLRSVPTAVTFTLLILIACSCASLDPLREKNADIIPIDESNYRLLEGRYSAHSGKYFFSFPDFVLLDELSHVQNARGFRWAELKVLDEHTLEFAFSHINGSVQVHTLEGHFEDGCFNVDYCRDAAGVLLLFWAFNTKSRRICLHESHNLICSRSSAGPIFMLALPMSVYSNYEEFQVRRLEE